MGPLSGRSLEPYGPFLCAIVGIPGAAGIPPEVANFREFESVPVRPKKVILVLADVPIIRSMARLVLTQSGYEVVVATSGRHALEMLAASQPIDLLLADSVMPDIGGLELAGLAQQLGVGVVVMARSFVDPSLPTLIKPFRPETLVSKVQEVLADRS